MPSFALPQAHFESVRAAELVAAQRLEAAERRKMEERERRLRQVKGQGGGVLYAAWRQPVVFEDVTP